MFCDECFEPIDEAGVYVESPRVGRSWHVRCAPPVEPDEPSRYPRRFHGRLPGLGRDKQRRQTREEREADEELLRERGVLV